LARRGRRQIDDLVAMRENVRMRKRERGLLGEIERDVLDEDKSLANALRKCIILGGHAGSTDLREWATRELRGYGGEDNLPEYRMVAAPILIDAVNPRVQVRGQRISPRVLPDFVAETVEEKVELRGGIGELEAFIRQCDATGEPVDISLPMGADIARLMNHQIGEPLQQILSVYWRVGPASLRGVTDQVRTTLAELVGELRAGMGDDQDVPSAELASQAMNVAVHGRKSNVTVTSAQSSGGGESIVGSGRETQPESSHWSRARKIGAFIVGGATILATVVALVQWLG